MKSCEQTTNLQQMQSSHTNQNREKIIGVNMRVDISPGSLVGADFKPRDHHEVWHEERTHLANRPESCARLAVEPSAARYIVVCL